MSTGLPVVAVGGRMPASDALRWSLNPSTSRPRAIRRSAASATCPPPSPAIATRRPLGWCGASSTWRRSIICCGVSTRYIPLARHAASTAIESLTRAPVCDCATRALAFVAPMVSRTTGLPAAAADSGIMAELGQFQSQVAALRDQADRSGAKLVPGEVQFGPGVRDAETVGPDQQRAGRADAISRGLLQG